MRWYIREGMRLYNMRGCGERVCCCCTLRHRRLVDTVAGPFDTPNTAVGLTYDRATRKSIITIRYWYGLRVQGKTRLGLLYAGYG